MSRDWYFAPAGLDPSGSGSKQNPIYGLSNIASLGIAEGDRVIITGKHYERLIIPQNNIRVISDGAVFDGTDSLNGSNRLATTPVIYAFEPNGSAWQQVSASPNIWKKGSAVTVLLFIDNTWVEPWPLSNNTNVAATVIAGLEEFEWSTVYEALDGSDRVLYLRLPLGKTPGNYDIRCSGRRIFSGSSTAGYIMASQKDRLNFEGEFAVTGYANIASMSTPFWFDRCTNLTNANGQFKINYSAWGVRITAGDGVSIRARGDYLLNAPVSIDAADPVSGIQYIAGTIEIYDWYADHCGWMPAYNGIGITYGDADGGVAVGYKGGTFNKLIIRDGISISGGPSVATLKSGWLGSLQHGSGIVIETADAGEVKEIDIRCNVIKSAHARAIGVGASGLIFTGKINISENVVEDTRGCNIASNWVVPIIGARPTKIGSTRTDINVSNNVIKGGTHSISAIGVGNSQALTSNMTICNNVFHGVTIESGYAPNYGMVRVIDNITGTIKINGNITDIVDGGVFGRNGSAAAITTFAAWRAAGYDINGQQGTVSLNPDYSLSAGTANPIFAGIDYWSPGPNPTAINGKPRPNKYSDVGAFQGTSHEFHPSNLASNILRADKMLIP